MTDTNDLAKRLRNAGYIAFGDSTIDHSTAEQAADRIEELEAELKEQALQYLSDTGQLGERIGELTEVLEEVDAWVEGLGYYADEGTELVPVFKKVKAILGKG